MQILLPAMRGCTVEGPSRTLHGRKRELGQVFLGGAGSEEDLSQRLPGWGRVRRDMRKENPITGTKFSLGLDLEPGRSVWSVQTDEITRTSPPCVLGSLPPCGGKYPGADWVCTSVRCSPVVPPHSVHLDRSRLPPWGKPSGG